MKEKEPFFRKILNNFVLKPFLGGIFKVRISGIENIPDMGSPAVISGNHVESFDAASLIQGIDRHIFFMGKIELLKSGFGKFAVKHYEIIPVDRKHVGLNLFKEVDQKIKEGRLVGIYPEGTKKGILKGKTTKNGAVDFALRQKIPIIPVAFDPNFKPFKENYIRIGKEILIWEYLKEDEDISDKKVINRLTNILMDKIFYLLDEKDKIKYFEAIAKRKQKFNN